MERCYLLVAVTPKLESQMCSHCNRKSPSVQSCSKDKPITLSNLVKATHWERNQFCHRQHYTIYWYLQQGPGVGPDWEGSINVINLNFPLPTFSQVFIFFASAHRPSTAAEPPDYMSKNTDLVFSAQVHWAVPFPPKEHTAVVLADRGLNQTLLPCTMQSTHMISATWSINWTD